MKLLRNCNIAVCFSGQSRTYKQCHQSIKNLFTSKLGNTFHFFGHTWDSNTYKFKNKDSVEIHTETIENLQELESNLRNLYPFKELIVEKDEYKPVLWGNLFYSAMRSNFLKQKYEAENNMMFDLVVKARYDVFYKDGKCFEDYLPPHIEEKTLYSNFGFMRNEYFLPNPDDVIYAGTSLTMDLIDSLYNALIGQNLFAITGSNGDNLAYKMAGPGVLIHKWMTAKNILPIHTPISYAVCRKQSTDVDYVNDWENAYKIGALLF